MSQTVAFVLPLPVALALVFVVLVLLALSAVALSLRTPVPLRLPAGDEGPGVRSEEEAAFRLGHLHIDGLAEGSPSQRRVR
jgi:hypothetical protein